MQWGGVFVFWVTHVVSVRGDDFSVSLDCVDVFVCDFFPSFFSHIILNTDKYNKCVELSLSKGAFQLQHPLVCSDCRRCILSHQ